MTLTSCMCVYQDTFSSTLFFPPIYTKNIKGVATRGFLRRVTDAVEEQACQFMEGFDRFDLVYGKI